jgi:hypothetical protein
VNVEFSFGNQSSTIVDDPVKKAQSLQGFTSISGRAYNDDMKNAPELLRELEKHAHYISVHEQDDFLRQKAHGMNRTIKQLKELLDPPKPSKPYDLEKAL